MRSTIRLMTTTAIALIAGISLSAAQGFTRDPGGPAATPNVPGQERSKDGTPHRPESQGTPQDRGQMQRGEEPKPRPSQPQRDGRPPDPTTGQAPQQRNPEPQRGSKGDREPIQKGQSGQMRPDQLQGQKSPTREPDQTEGQAGAHTPTSQPNSALASARRC
jgi:hypothetical protein